VNSKSYLITFGVKNKLKAKNILFGGTKTLLNGEKKYV